MSFLALAAAFDGCAPSSCDDELDLAAVDAAGRVDAIDIEAHRIDRRRISARRRAGERAGHADDVILRAAAGSAKAAAPQGAEQSHS